MSAIESGRVLILGGRSEGTPCPPEESAWHLQTSKLQFPEESSVQVFLAPRSAVERGTYHRRTSFSSNHTSLTTTRSLPSPAFPQISNVSLTDREIQDEWEMGPAITRSSSVSQKELNIALWRFLKTQCAEVMGKNELRSRVQHEGAVIEALPDSGWTAGKDKSLICLKKLDCGATGDVYQMYNTATGKVRPYHNSY